MTAASQAVASGVLEWTRDLLFSRGVLSDAQVLRQTLPQALHVAVTCARFHPLQRPAVFALVRDWDALGAGKNNEKPVETPPLSTSVPPHFTDTKTCWWMLIVGCSNFVFVFLGKFFLSGFVLFKT